MEAKKEIAVFAGGCFWCTEAIYQEIRGIIDIKPGYTGGTVPNPTYEQVCSGQTGHAEGIKIEYDPSQISYNDLLTIFFGTHDPTTMNRQGNDVGTQYRSAVFYTNDEQKKLAEEYIKKLNETDFKDKNIVTQVQKFDTFYVAEDYHQRYYERNAYQPYCQFVINPKLAKLKEKFTEFLKTARK